MSRYHESVCCVSFDGDAQKLVHALREIHVSIHSYSDRTLAHSTGIPRLQFNIFGTPPTIQSASCRELALPANVSHQSHVLWEESRILPEFAGETTTELPSVRSLGIIHN